MKRWVNGSNVEVTPEEIAELQAESEPILEKPTIEERIAALEEQLAATKVLLGVE